MRCNLLVPIRAHIQLYTIIQNIEPDLHFIVHYAAFKSIKWYEYGEISF